METTTGEIKYRLLQFGIKPSLQRIAIMKYLLMHATHPTVDTIFSHLHPNIPTLSKTTVYNTLNLFTKQGAALCLTIDDKNAHYDGDISNHAHFHCDGCGCIKDLPIAKTSHIEVNGLEGLHISTCHIYYKGYCEDCKKELDKLNTENRTTN